MRKVPVSFVWNLMSECWRTAKICKGEVKLDAKKNFVTLRMIQHWNKLPSKEVDALCLSDVQEAFR